MTVTETIPQKYRIFWTVSHGNKVIEDGSITVKVTKPRMYEVPGRPNEYRPMPIRSQAVVTADSFLKKNYANYRKYPANALRIVPIEE